MTRGTRDANDLAVGIVLAKSPEDFCVWQSSIFTGDLIHESSESGAVPSFRARPVVRCLSCVPGDRVIVAFHATEMVDTGTRVVARRGHRSCLSHYARNQWNSLH